MRGRWFPEAPFRHAGLLHEMNRNGHECLKQLFIYMLWQNEFFWKPTRRSVWFWQNEHERVRSAPSPSDALKMNKIQHSHERFPLNLSCSQIRLTVSSACTRHTRQQLNIHRARSLLPQFDHFHPQKDKLSKLVEFNAPIGLWCCSLWGHHLLINTRTTTVMRSLDDHIKKIHGAVRFPDIAVF